jgi:broad specificity polyphosphatase/5'/3'-nucleotidase SurE
MDSMMPALQSGDLSGVMNQMETMKPQLESSLKTVGGQIESKVGESPAIANLQSTMTKANMDFQKESVNYAAQSQQTLIKIEKLLKQLLPNAIGMY